MAPIINEFTIGDQDKFLLDRLRYYLEDFLNHSFSIVIERILDELNRDSGLLKELDKFYFFKMNTFML